MVHAGEDPLVNGQLPMSYILENERLRHWVGDGTVPSNLMFDVVARQKLTMRFNSHNPQPSHEILPAILSMTLIPGAIIYP